MKRKILIRGISLFLMITASSMGMRAYAEGCCTEEGSIKDGKCHPIILLSYCLREQDASLADCNRFDSTNCTQQN